MENKTRKLRLCAVLTVLNILFIWGNSLLPGEVSGAISKWVRDVLVAILSLNLEGSGTGHGLLRKLAHFTEFACLGGALTWLFTLAQRPRAWALLCGFLVAGVDETIQRFVPDRGPSITDVLIDTSGVAAGIGLVLLGYTICKNRRWRSQNCEKMDRVPSGNGNGSDHDGLQEKEK